MCNDCGFFGHTRKSAFSPIFSIETFIEPANNKGMVVFEHLTFSCQLFEMSVHPNHFILKSHDFRFGIQRSFIFCYTEKHINHKGTSSSQKPCCRILHTDLSSSIRASKKSYCFYPLPKKQLELQISMCNVAKQVEKTQARLIQARLFTLALKGLTKFCQNKVNY